MGRKIKKYFHSIPAQHITGRLNKLHVRTLTVASGKKVVGVGPN